MKKIAIIGLCSIALFGCQADNIYSGDVYTADQAKRVQTVNYGTITSIQNVQIQTNANGSSSNSALGTLMGGALGGVLGHSIGGGSGKDIATVAGAIGGALAGSSIENATSAKNALQIEVKPESGGSPVVVVQAAKQGEFYVGQRVRLIYDGSKMAVSP